MTDELVKQIDECRDYLHENAPSILDRAADRIEILEEALRKIETLELDPRNSGQMWVEALRQIARAAIKGKKDD
jgi:hypothetical protein